MRLLALSVVFFARWNGGGRGKPGLWGGKLKTTAGYRAAETMETSWSARGASCTWRRARRSCEQTARITMVWMWFIKTEPDSECHSSASPLRCLHVMNFLASFFFSLSLFLFIALQVEIISVRKMYISVVYRRSFYTDYE